MSSSQENPLQAAGHHNFSTQTAPLSLADRLPPSLRKIVELLPVPSPQVEIPAHHSDGVAYAQQSGPPSQFVGPIGQTLLLVHGQSNAVDSVFSYLSRRQNWSSNSSYWTLLISQTMKAAVDGAVAFSDCAFVNTLASVYDSGAGIKGTASLLVLLPFTQQTGETWDECSSKDFAEASSDDSNDDELNSMGVDGSDDRADSDGDRDSDDVDTDDSDYADASESSDSDVQLGDNNDNGDEDANDSFSGSINDHCDNSRVHAIDVDEDLTQNSAESNDSQQPEVNPYDDLYNDLRKQRRARRLPCKLYDGVPPVLFQSHVLSSTFHPIALMPILCIADEENISFVMCSALHQRAVLRRHDVPVVGIAQPRSGGVYQVLLGWADESGLNITMPTQHCNLDRSPSNGTFDVGSLQSVYALSQFLERLGAYFASMCSSRPTEEMTLDIYAGSIIPHRWRFDTGSEFGSAYDMFSRRIELWRCDVHEHRANTACVPAVDGSSILHTVSPSVAWSVYSNTGLVEDSLRVSSRRGSLTLGFDDDSRPTSPNLQIPSLLHWLLHHHVLVLPVTSNYGKFSGGTAQMWVNFFRSFLPSGLDSRSLPNGSPPLSEHTGRCEGGPAESPLLGRIDHGSTDIFVSLVHEMVVLFCQKEYPDSYTWTTAWQDIADWCWNSPRLDDMPGMRTSCNVVTGQVNYLRCVEYDHVVQALSMLFRLHFVPVFLPTNYFPYHKIMARMFGHVRDLLQEALFLLESSTPRGLRKDLLQEFTATKDLVMELLNMACAADSRFIRSHSDPVLFGQCAIEFNARFRDWYLTQYPIGGGVDAAVTVAVEGFLDKLSEIVPADVIQTFVDTFLFFRDDAGYVAPGSPRSLHLPFLLVKHQQFDATLENVTQNELRMAVISASRFLAALGITNFPTFGLATYGRYGVLCQAWYSTEDHCSYVVTSNLEEHRFNLSEKAGILRYIELSHKLKGSTKELQARFESVRPALLERMRTEEGRASLRWTLRSQLSEADI